MKDYLKALRLGRWPRSASIVIGSGAYWALKMRFSMPSPAQLLKLLLAFILTWAISTANYIINEIADAPYDVHYPDKASRPVASGRAREDILLAVFILLGGASLVVSFYAFNRVFSLALFSLLMAGIFYNVKPIRLKDKPFADSVFESVNNPIRLTLGWAFLEPSFPDPFLLLSWWAFGNFLMAGKRLSEKLYLGESAEKYRRSLRFYSLKSLKAMMLSSALAFFLFLLVFCLRNHLNFTLAASLFSLPFMVKFYRDSSLKAMDEPEQALVKGSLLASFALFAFILLLGLLLDLRFF